MSIEGHLGPITPREAEYVAAGIMRDHLGFEDARVTTASGDGGVDVVAKQAVAQVKHWGSQVGRPAIQQLYGARGADHSKKMVFFCSGGYSRQAIEYANEVGVALFTFDAAGSCWSVNEPAEALVEEAKKQDKAVMKQARREQQLADWEQQKVERKKRKEESKARAEAYMAKREEKLAAGWVPVFSWRSVVALMLLIFSLGPIFSWSDYTITFRSVLIASYWLVASLLLVLEIRRYRKMKQRAQPS